MPPESIVLLSYARQSRRVQRLSFFAVVLEELVGQYAHEDDRAHHGEIERAWDAQQVHEVLQDEEEGGANQNADDGPFAPAQAATAQHGCSDAVKFIKISMRGRR